MRRSALGTNRFCVIDIAMREQDKCRQCGAVYYRAPLITPFNSIACVVCGTTLARSDSFPGNSVVVGAALATVPGAGTFDSSVRSPGTDVKEA